MADLVTLTIDGKALQAPPGALVIDVAREAGIEIPAFCYYEGLSLQAACRMCLVEVEGAPKLMTSCTLPVREGMVVRTKTPAVVASRKAMLEFLLTNHPLDCPVCDKGGECELQDTVFRYGAGEGRFTEIKHHVDEKRFSPVVFYDAPRCILCYRCVRICDEGMGVKALGVVNRGATTEIAPNKGDHLECDECGMCIDICPVGALTSSTYRYHTRPWEMKHTGTICAHCSNGCKTTLGVRTNRIIRANNRDRSGINGEFLCIKGRFAFDFVHNEERLTTPLVRGKTGFQAVTWSDAIRIAAERLLAARDNGCRIGVIGSTKTTNEENLFLQEFARSGLRTNNIDHRRSGDLPALLHALGGRPDALAATADLYSSRAILVIGADLAQQHPLLAFQVRANWRHHQSRTYVVSRGPVREDQFAVRSVRAAAGEELPAVESLTEAIRGEHELAVLYGPSIAGDSVGRLVAWGDSLGIPVKYVCLLDCVNSRGALDLGLAPDFGPGYQAVETPGLELPAMFESGLDALWVIGANPLRRHKLVSANTFVIAQDLFLTETAQNANLVLPAASLYEKTGTVTNVCGESQRLERALEVMGPKTDLDIFRLLAGSMGIEVHAAAPEAQAPEPPAPGASVPVFSVEDTLFTSGSLGRYSKVLNTVKESPGGLYREGAK